MRYFLKNGIAGFFAALAVLGALLAAGRAGAAEIHILTAAAIQSVFSEIVPVFERESGHKVILDYATMGAITQRVMAGASADFVISSGPSIAGLMKQNRLKEGTTVRIAKVGVGVVIRSGTPKPRLASVDDFRNILLAAQTVVYANPEGGGAAGIHIARVLQNLGIAGQLAPRTRFGAGGDVSEVTFAQGDGAVGMTQISEIVGKRDVQLVGPLPDELQNYTEIAGGDPGHTQQPEAVRAFVAFLKSPAAIAVMKTKGLQAE